MRSIALLPLILFPFLLAACAGGYPAKTAMDSGDMMRFRAILDAGVDYDKPVYAFNLNLMEYAACKGRDQAIVEMLAKGAEIDKGHEVSAHFGARYTPLARALLCNADGPKTSTVKLLLSRGAKVDPISMTAVSEHYGGTEIGTMVRNAYARQSGRSSEATASTEPVPVPVAAPAPIHTPAPAERASLIPRFSQSPSPDDYAVIVGIENYADLPPARFAERDAASFKTFVRAMGVPERNIMTLTGARATRTGLAKAFEAWLPNNVSEKSRVYVYYSGHGAPDVKTKQAYLVPVDGDPQYLEQTGYPLDRLYAQLNKLKTRNVLVALDSCFSGAGGRSVIPQGTRPLVGKVDAVPQTSSRIAIMSASDGDQISGSNEEAGYGLFTYNLLNGLNGAAKDARGQVTLKSLYDYVKPKVQDEARRANREQTPQLQCPSSDSFILRPN